MDIFERITKNPGPLGQYNKKAHGYFIFPKLEGELAPRMKFRGKEVLTWSLNNYLGLANHPEVRKVDAEAAKEWGLAYPMGARMMSGHTSKHEELEAALADFVGKEDSYLVNYGYQGMVSIIDALANRNDAIVYDSESHACIMDGVFLHKAKGGKSWVYQHNDMVKADKMLQFAKRHIEKTGGGILVITEGVFGMAGDLGALDKLVELKKKYNFRILVDDAHGFGTMGKTGAGVPEHFGVSDEIDVHFGTFAKSMAGIGGFVASNEDVVNYLRYNLRSQIFAKSLPMPMVIGALKRLELLKTKPELKENLWKIVRALQGGLREKGFNIGNTQSPVTPVYFEKAVSNDTDETNDVNIATQLTMDLRENYNLFCSIVVYPVIPKGQIMLRLIPTALHTMEDVEYTIESFGKIQEKLETGKYDKEQFPSIF